MMLLSPRNLIHELCEIATLVAISNHEDMAACLVGTLKSGIAWIRQSTSGGAQPFRFLDLPPELRNRIYRYAAEVAMADPICIPSKLPSLTFKDVVYLSCLEILKRSTDEALEAIIRKAPRRLAMLSTSRKVHNEASTIYYENASMTFRSPTMSEALSQVQRPPHSIRTKLQFVNHVQMDIWDAMAFLFASARDKTCQVSSEGHIQKSRILSTEATFELRCLFFNIERFSISGCEACARPPDNPELHAVGLQVICNLANSSKRAILLRLFPRLRDIITMGRLGVERFWKNEDGSWTIYYSREVIPLGDREASGPFRLGSLCDSDTGMVVSTTLGCLR